MRGARRHHVRVRGHGVKHVQDHLRRLNFDSCASIFIVGLLSTLTSARLVLSDNCSQIRNRHLRTRDHRDQYRRSSHSVGQFQIDLKPDKGRFGCRWGFRDFIRREGVKS